MAFKVGDTVNLKELYEVDGRLLRNNMPIDEYIKHFCRVPKQNELKDVHLVAVYEKASDADYRLKDLRRYVVRGEHVYRLLYEEWSNWKPKMYWMDNLTGQWKSFLKGEVTFKIEENLEAPEYETIVSRNSGIYRYNEALKALDVYLSGGHAPSMTVETMLKHLLNVHHWKDDNNAIDG